MTVVPRSSGRDGWAQALAIEALLGDQASDWLANTAAAFSASGGNADAQWLREIGSRIEHLRTYERHS